MYIQVHDMLQFFTQKLKEINKSLYNHFKITISKVTTGFVSFTEGPKIDIYLSPLLFL